MSRVTANRNCLLQFDHSHCQALDFASSRAQRGACHAGHRLLALMLALGECAALRHVTVTRQSRDMRAAHVGGGACGLAPQPVKYGN